MTNTLFNEIAKNHFKTLDKYVPVVDRVHGDAHPEFHEVKRLYEVINTKTKESKKAKTAPSLAEDFAKLREITNNYALPAGVCETYDAVYKMLSELDVAYNS